MWSRSLECWECGLGNSAQVLAWILKVFACGVLVLLPRDTEVLFWVLSLIHKSLK